MEEKNPHVPTGYSDWDPDDFQVPVPPPGHETNDLSLLDAGLVAAGFGTILWRAHHLIHVATKNLGLRVAEQLLKGRVAGHNRVINISPDDCDRAHVHQGLKILPLTVSVQVGLGYAAKAFGLVGPGGGNLGGRLSNQFCKWATKETLCRRVEVRNPVVLVQHHHRIAHAFDHGIACHRSEIEHPKAEETPGPDQA